MMRIITTITEIMPTTAPALKMPSIAEQLLRQSINTMMDGKYNLFMAGFYTYNMPWAE